MANRRERKAAAAAAPKMPKLKNLSGCEKSCGNCAKTVNRVAVNWNRAVRAQPKLEEDQVICIATPAPTQKHVVECCSLWSDTLVSPPVKTV